MLEKSVLGCFFDLELESGLVTTDFLKAVYKAPWKGNRVIRHIGKIADLLLEFDWLF